MKYILTLLLVSFTLRGEAQSPLFFVDLIKGDVVVRHDKKNTEKVKVRSVIFKNDIITIANDQSELTLVDTYNKSTVLSKKGTYSVNDLLKAPFQQSAGITSKYFSMVWKELSNPSKGVRAGLKDMVSSWGGVERGGCAWHLAPFDGWTTYDDSIRFSWASTSPDLYYGFTLFDEANDVVMEVSVRDTQIVIWRYAWVKSARNAYGWRINGTRESCNEDHTNQFFWVTKEEYDRATREIIDQVVDDGSARHNLEIAERLLAKNYYQLAASYLQKID